MLLDDPDWAAQTWEQLIRVACVPGHRVNAEWTHQRLAAMTVPERDAAWSEWLIGRSDAGGETAVPVLLDWASHSDRPVQDDAVRLGSLTLGWLLTTTDRRVRDLATKALVSVGERAPGAFAQAVRAFRGCNDPYVVERLAAALCGVALRSGSPETVIAMADAAAELVADDWPEHLLTRDFLRRTSDAARRHGWLGPAWLPPYGTTWPVDAMSADAIEELAVDGDVATIWHSIHREFGDFGRYEMEAAVEYFGEVDKDLVERAVFTRVVGLGWTAERFGRLDRGRFGGHDGTVERYGKKYQWIGFYEVLGRLADTHEVVDAGPYVVPEQVIYRDLDPTVLTPARAPWYEPARPTFPAAVATYPADVDGVPDPLDLITPPGWLALVRHGNWTQDVPPDAPALKIWMQIRGYLVPTATAAAVRDFAANQNWDGRWMPENADVHSQLLATHLEWDQAPQPSRQAIPTLFQPVHWYGGTGTSRGRGAGDEPTGYVPTRRLAEALDLKPGVDFRWEDADGLAVVDPIAGSPNESTLLMRRDLVGRLSDAGYTLFWTVLMTKQLNDHSYNRQRDKAHWVVGSASYLLVGDAVEPITAHASVRRPGRDPKLIDWVVRNRR